jgi:acyl-CoA synthetase (NDP forming)
MIGSINDSPLFPIANPRSIAFFGASNKMTTMGTIQMMSMKELGYDSHEFIGERCGTANRPDD